MRFLRLFGIGLLVPQGKTDKFFLDAIWNKTKAHKFEFAARFKKGLLFVEVIKDVNHKFSEWPKGSFMYNAQHKQKGKCHDMPKMQS